MKLGQDPKPGQNSYGGFGNVMLGGTEYSHRDVYPQLPAQASVELTFTPVGPLIDGSIGQMVTVRLKDAVNASSLNEANTYGKAGIGEYRNIHTGRCRVTARFVLPSGGTRPARVAAIVPRYEGGASLLKAAASQTIQWEPSRSAQYETRAVTEIGLYVLP